MENELYILWTSQDAVTAENMVMMYAANAMKNGWWDKVTVILWGASQKLVKENDKIKYLLESAREDGVSFTACRSCAQKLGTIEVLEELGVELKYWGIPLTELIKSGKKLITI